MIWPNVRFKSDQSVKVPSVYYSHDVQMGPPIDLTWLAGKTWHEGGGGGVGFDVTKQRRFVSVSIHEKAHFIINY